MKPKKSYRIPRHYMEMGEYLRTLRARANLTQREVSMELGYSSAQFISNFERGIALPPLKKLRVMQKLYGADMDRIIDITLEAKRKTIRQELVARGRGLAPNQ